jgi:hypothetical protein
LPSDSSLLPEGSHTELRIDIKHSSYKKTLPFLKHLQATGLLTLVATDRIATVNRQHDLFRLYKDRIKVEQIEDFRTQVSVSGGGGGTGDHSTSDALMAKLKIIDLCKFPRPLRDLFVSVIQSNPTCHEAISLEDHLSWLTGDGPYGECMTHSEVSNFSIPPSLMSDLCSSNGSSQLTLRSNLSKTLREKAL